MKKRETLATSPLRQLDPVAIVDSSRKETRNREAHLPPISVYRWWARRTTTVNSEILAALDCDGDRRLLVADPFSGGGVIPLVAVARGHQVYAQDVNPWAVSGLHSSLNLPPKDELQQGVAELADSVTDLLEKAYATESPGGEPATVAHTFRVAVSSCSGCGHSHRLFPHAMVTLCRRKERKEREALLACPAGHIFRGYWDRAGRCSDCGRETDPDAAYLDRRVAVCPKCGNSDRLEQRVRNGAWRWEVVLLEKVRGNVREFAAPTPAECKQAQGARWKPRTDLGLIPEGRETAVLRRHGFMSWNELYPPRQRVVMESLLTASEDIDGSDSVREALRMGVVGVAEMAGFASRWDRWYLKSYETMARHRFNFTTFTVEPNVWGTRFAGRGTFIRRVKLLKRASAWLEENRSSLAVAGPIMSNARRRRLSRTTDVMVVEGSSERMILSASSADVVLTDPPYHDDVQYAELSLPFRVWGGLSKEPLKGEAVANGTTKAHSDYSSYSELLTRIFRECRRVLQEDGHLIFSYANREPRAWAALFSALQVAGFQACGYTIVHSDNETNHAKKNVRSCNLDLILDLVPAGRSVEQWHCAASKNSLDEEKFLHRAGGTFLNVGELAGEWEDVLVAELKDSQFIKGPEPETPEAAAASTA